MASVIVIQNHGVFLKRLPTVMGSEEGLRKVPVLAGWSEIGLLRYQSGFSP